MSLPHDISRCLGQHTSGRDCERKDQCERYLQRAERGERTPSTWALCSEKAGAFPFQIKGEGKRNGS